MGYKMKGFTHPGTTKQSPLTKKPKNDPKSPEYLKYWSDPANRGELESKAKGGSLFNMGGKFTNLLAQIKAKGEGGGSSGGGKHGDEMHTGGKNNEVTPEVTPEIKTVAGPATKPLAPGKAPENLKEE